MTPSTTHRLLSVPTDTRLYLNWPLPRVSLRRRVFSLLFGEENPSSPSVDRAAFRAAFDLLHTDPEASAAAFRALGYNVTIRKSR